MTPSSLPPANTEAPEEAQFSSSRAPRPSPLSNHPAVRNYMLFCLAAHFLLVICLADRGLEWWCLVPPLIGCFTLLTHWSHGPPLVIVSLTGLLGMTAPRARWKFEDWARFQAPTLMDLVLCIAVLAYVIGHYRLLSLMRPIFPADSRRPDERTKANRRRSADLVTAWEMAILGLALPVWTGLSVLIWTWMTENEMEEALPLDMPRELWRGLRLAWLGLTLLAAAGIIANYRRLTSATMEECLLYLQDQCWRHTRREQSILNRWLTWARLRAQRKKESL